jgi:hypothetical protein
MITLSTVLLAACLALPAPKTRTDPHAFMNVPTQCATCHRIDARSGEVIDHEFTGEISSLCGTCHTKEHLGRSHPVDVSMRRPAPGTEVPGELPLGDDEEITCGTCHDPHSRGFLLTGLSAFQDPFFEEVQPSGKVAYYKSYYLRLQECGRGFDPLCTSCHVAY